MKSHTGNEINSGWRSLLTHSTIYKLVQTLFGEARTKNLILNGFVIPAGLNSRLLDMGCGPGNILKHIPDSINYIGFDINPAYIKTAREEYKERENTTFFCASTADSELMDKIQPNSIDLAIIHGVLHHVDDSVTEEFFSVANQSLVPGGKLFILEPVWLDNQSRIKRAVMSLDRGKNIKHINDWQSLFNSCSSGWGEVNLSIRHDLSRLYDLLVCSIQKTTDSGDKQN